MNHPRPPLALAGRKSGDRQPSQAPPPPLRTCGKGVTSLHDTHSQPRHDSSFHVSWNDFLCAAPSHPVCLTISVNDGYVVYGREVHVVALRALSTLITDMNCQRAIVNAGLVPAMLGLVEAPNPDADTVRMAATALYNLCLHEAFLAITDDGAIRLATKLLESRDAETYVTGTRCLTLLSYHKRTCVMMATSGIVECLRGHVRAESKEVVFHCATMLSNLARAEAGGARRTVER
jgi:hypothetical protein